MDRFLIRGLVITLLAMTGLIYEILTDQEGFVLIIYGILAVIGIYVILKVRELKN